MKKCMPSPARYTLPTLTGYNGHDIRKNRQPAYSFGLRLHDKAAYQSPGPNRYNVPPIIGGKNNAYERAPAYSIHGRLTTRQQYQTPAPNTYGLQNFKPGQRAPAYTMGQKLREYGETMEC